MECAFICYTRYNRTHRTMKEHIVRRKNTQYDERTHSTMRKRERAKSVERESEEEHTCANFPGDSQKIQGPI